MKTTNLAAPANPLVPNGTFFVELIIFLIVLFVMWRYILPPILTAMQERADRVRRTAEERQEAMDKLAAAEQRYSEALAGARAEAGEIRGEARTEGQRVLSELRGQAEQEANAIRERGAAELAWQRERAMRELQPHVNGLAAALAGRIVGADVPEATSRGEA